MRRIACLLMGSLLSLGAWGSLFAAEFNIRDFGAVPNADADATKSIVAALAACEQAGGGVVFVPAGTYIVSRQANEPIILQLPSNTILRGEGPASILKFHPRVNLSNFWAMIGVCSKDCRNTTVCQLHLDGSNTFPKYERGVPEHNHGVFLHRENGVIENLVFRDLLIENFSGDCVGVSRGCRNISIISVSMRNFVRQGIQLGGDKDARDYLVTGCQDLEGTVLAGGSTIHVEHARGLKNVIIADNRCRQSILAGGVDGLILRGNTVTGCIIANYDANTVVQGNIVRGNRAKGAIMQFGFANGLLIKDNIVLADSPDLGGIYVWGCTQYDPSYSKSVSILDNLLRVQKEPISLNGVTGALLRDNTAPGISADPVLKRSQDVKVINREEQKP